jgi:CheY-like chemotaxis protein
VGVTRVVVADADAPTRNLVHLVLAGDGWSVRDAVDAGGTVRAVAAEVPDVLVVDADLPDVGGLATTRALRRQPQTAGIGVVLLTDLDRPVSAGDLAEARVEVVLERPFGSFALLEAIEQALTAT